MLLVLPVTSMSLLNRRFTSSSVSGGTHPSFFLHLKEILEKVGHVGSVLGLKQIGRVDYKPESLPVGCEKTGSTKPDCNIVLCEPTFGEQYKGKTLLRDIFGKLELRQGDGPKEVYQVRGK